MASASEKTTLNQLYDRYIGQKYDLKPTTKANYIDDKGKKVNEFFLTMSLRVEDSSVEKSNDGEIVDFIFSKDASMAKYDTLLVEDKHKSIPEGIK